MNTAFAPRLALVLHATEDPLSNAWQGRDGPRVLSLHHIITSKHGPLLDAGRLLSQAEAKNLGEVLLHPDAANTISTVKLLPPHLLNISHGSLTWYRPAHRTRMFWHLPEGHTAFEVVLPGLVFHVREGVLHVAAFGGEERPTATTVLYHAPLANVYSDTHICTGNALLPRSMEPNSIDAWERVLLGTNYTHVNHPKTLAGGAATEELVAFWRRRQRYKAPPQARCMAELGMTLCSWLTRLAERGA